MSQATGSTSPSPHQLRAELEAMVLGDLLGPAGGEDEELTERTVRDRYLVGVLAPSRSGATAARPAGGGRRGRGHPPDPRRTLGGGQRHGRRRHDRRRHPGGPGVPAVLVRPDLLRR